jgi:acetate kinase
MAHSLGGIDAIVFTGGIGENSPKMRQRIGASLGWLGVELDDAANNESRPRIGTAASRVAAMVIACDEEAVIAAHGQKLLAALPAG